MLLLAILLIAGGSYLYWIDRRLSTRRHTPLSYRDERNVMPAEIATATLIMSEKRIDARLGDVLIPVRAEQVYRTMDGRIIPVENKNRNFHRVFPYDLIEIAAQRLAITQARHAGLAGAEVSRYGYVRTANRKDGSVRYHRVELMSEPELATLAERYFKVRDGLITAASQSNPKACVKCQYRSSCSRSAAPISH